MLLSIIITTRNRIDQLKKCIKSLKESDLPGGKNWELIVIDDASWDGTKKLKFRSFGINMGKIVHNTSQQMMVKSRNQGARLASGKYVLFVDDDNQIDTKMIKLLIGFANKHPNFGITGPSMYYLYNRKKYLDYQTINFFTGKTDGHLDGTNNKSGQYYESDGIPNVFMIKKSLFKKIGYFDELLVQTFTEPDMAFKFKRKKYRCVVYRDAKTYHHIKSQGYFEPRIMGGGTFKQKAYFLMRNRTLIVFRYGNLMHKFIYATFFSWFWPIIYSAFMLKHQRLDLVKLYWLGFIDGLRYIMTGRLVNSLTEKKV